MKKISFISLLIFSLALFLTGCSPTKNRFDLGNIPILGSLVQSTATSTPLPSPTSTPTPLPSVRIDLAERLLEINGDYDQALLEFQIAQAQATDENTRLIADLGIARIYYLLGDQATSLTLLRTIVDSYPNNPRRANAYYFLGQIYSTLGRYIEAAAAYDEFLRLRPGEIDSAIQNLKGDALLNGGDTFGAINAYLAALQFPHLGGDDQLNIKLAGAYKSSGNPEIAIQIYKQIFNSTTNDYTRAQMDFQIGQILYEQGDLVAAYQYFQHAVDNYPTSYDTYSGLIILVNDAQPVNELQRGIVDYYAGKFSLAVEAFDRFLAVTPDHDGLPHYYKGLALRAIGQENYPLFSSLRSEAILSTDGIQQDNQAIASWQALIDEHPTDPHWADSWDEIAYTQWAYTENPEAAARTMLEFVSRAPTDSRASEFLFAAGRYFERAEMLEDAAATWERMADLYPAYQDTFRALMLAGVTRYRLVEYENAEVAFQRSLLLAIQPADQAAAYFWIGKCQYIRGDTDMANQSWQQAATRDPTGYYSERARELALGRTIFTPPAITDMAISLEDERIEAETWMQTTFTISTDISLSQPGDLVLDQRYIRGKAFHSLGLYDQAKAEFTNLREEIQNDPVRTYRFMQVLYDLGYYSQAILASRQILNLANLNDLDSLTAPIYFNHIRFGLYFKEIVIPITQDTGLDPLILYAMIRQESLFDGSARSSAGARGLLQLMPATGAEVAASEGWPSNYSVSDLDRPFVNLHLGASHLKRQLNYFNGEMFAALAAYNAGAGNTSIWVYLSQNDPDLLLEIIRYSETRQYIQYIYENYGLYKRFYGRDL